MRTNNDYRQALLLLSPELSDAKGSYFHNNDDGGEELVSSYFRSL